MCNTLNLPAIGHRRTTPLLPVSMEERCYFVRNNAGVTLECTEFTCLMQPPAILYHIRLWLRLTLTLVVVARDVLISYVFTLFFIQHT